MVWVVLDTLRPDRLELYGYERETAPFLTRFSRGAAVFDHAYSTSSWTAPATASLFTGLYPARHGVVEGLMAFRGRTLKQALESGSQTRRLNRIPLGVPTVTERLHEAGYATFGIAGNLNIGPRIGFDRAFDRFHTAQPGDDARTAAALVDAWAPDLLGADGPWFLYVHLNDAHSPYRKHAPWYRPARDRASRWRSAYDSDISYLDRALERMARRLDWTDDTIVVIASDHGELLGEHHLFGHPAVLHQELARVVLMIRGPGVPAQRVEPNVSLVDVLPTVLDLAGLEPADGDGRSLVPLLRGEPGARRALARRTLFLHRAPYRGAPGTWAAVRGSEKLVRDPEGHATLFDLDADPGEEAGSPPRDSAAGRRLRAALTEFREEAASAPVQLHEVELDAATLRRLEKLGYVTDAAPGRAAGASAPSQSPPRRP